MSAAFVNSFLANGTAAIYTPTAGNDVIIQVFGLGGTTSSLTSLTDSVGGDTVLTDFPYTLDVASHVGIAVFRVHNVTHVSHTFTANWAVAPSDAYFLVITEVSGISGLDTGAGTLALNTGNTNLPTTESLIPTANGDFLLAGIGVDNFKTLGAWSNAFTTVQSFASGPTFSAAYLVQASAASVNAAIGISATSNWAGLLVAYSAAGGGGAGAVLAGAATDTTSAAGALSTLAASYFPILLDDPGHINGSDQIGMGSGPGSGTGDTAEVAFTKLKQWAVDLNKMLTQLYCVRSIQTPTTGFTIALAAGVTQLVLNPAGVLPTGTVTFPPNPADNQPLLLMSSQTVTALTQNTSDGSTINGAPSGIAANLALRYRYMTSLNTWFREQ